MLIFRVKTYFDSSGKKLLVKTQEGGKNKQFTVFVGLAKQLSLVVHATIKVLISILQLKKLIVNARIREK